MLPRTDTSRWTGHSSVEMDTKQGKKEDADEPSDVYA